MLERLTGKDAMSARQLAIETGMHQQTLSRWLQHACSVAVMPSKRTAQTKTLQEKLRILTEASRLTGAELSRVLLREGVLLAEFEQWRLALAEDGRGSMVMSKRPQSLHTQICIVDRATQVRASFSYDTVSLLIST
jgi:hypothetical protein